MKRRIRSRDQLHRYFRDLADRDIPEEGWVIDTRKIAEFMSEQTGKVITAEHIHEVCRQKFAPLQTNPLNGKTYPLSTTKMSVGMLSEYLEQVWAWGAGMGIRYDVEIGGGHEKAR